MKNHKNHPRELKNIGDFVTVDNNGYLVKTVSLYSLQEELRPLIRECTSIILSIIGSNTHSIYIRGSVAKGTFLAGISDLDVFIVSREIINSDLLKKVAKSFYEINEGWKSVVGIEFSYMSASKLVKTKSPIYKYQTVCVYGDDLTPLMPSLRPGVDTTVHLLKIIDRVQESYPKVEEMTSQEEIKSFSIWIAKSLIRSSHELVAQDLRRFARDIYPCLEGASHFYPEQRELLRRTALVAIFGTTDKKALLEIMHEMQDFIEPKITLFLKRTRATI